MQTACYVTRNVSSSLSSELQQPTLDRHLAVGPLLRVRAVAVDSILVLQPSHLPHLIVAQPTVRVRVAELGCTAGHAVPAVALAHVQVDAMVAGDEGRLGPVGLDTAALRRPVFSCPDARVGVHGLARRERHAVTRLVVAEHADWGAVNVPPAVDTNRSIISDFVCPLVGIRLCLLNEKREMEMPFAYTIMQGVQEMV